MAQQLTLLLACASCVYALYEGRDDVDILTSSNFDSDVLQSPDYWIVEFYAPWCGHCQKLAPEWKKAATALKDVARVGAVDCDEHKDLAQKYGVQGFPTIKVFGPDKSNPEDFKGGRDADSIVDFVKKEIGPSAASSKLAQQVKYLEMYTFLYFEKMPKVLLFTEDNKLPGWYTSAAMKFKDGKKKTVSFAHVRSDEKKILKQFKFDVLPALVVCMIEKEGEAVYYQLGEDISSGGSKNVKIVKEFVDSVIAGSVEEDSKKPVPGFPSPDIPRKAVPTSLAALTHENINSVCFGHKHPMCVLGLLGTEQNPYKSVISDVAKKFRNDPFSFVYADVSRQTDFLAGFSLTAAQLPAVVLVKLGKRKRYAVLSSFDVAGISKSLDDALGGGMQFKKLSELPELLPDALLDSDSDAEEAPADGADEGDVDAMFGKDEV